MSRAGQQITRGRLALLGKLICVLMAFGLPSVAHGDCAGPAFGGCSNDNVPRSNGISCGYGSYLAPDGTGCVPSDHQYCGGGKYCLNVGDVCVAQGGCTSRDLCSKQIPIVRGLGNLGFEVAESLCAPFPDLLGQLRRSADEHDQPRAPASVPVRVPEVTKPPATVPVRRPPPASVRVDVWMRAFIPNAHPVLPNYIKKTDAGTWVLPAPDVPNLISAVAIDKLGINPYSGTCFETDNRGFNDAIDQSARVAVRFTIVIDGTHNLHLEKLENRDFVLIGASKNVDCATGVNRSSPRTATGGVTVGDVKASDNLRVFNVRASVANPFYALAGLSYAPKIDYEVVFQYDVLAKKITVHDVLGNFPSFEAYYRINGVTKVGAQLPPKDDSTAASLFDGGTGINMRNFDYVIDLSTIAD